MDNNNNKFLAGIPTFITELIFNDKRFIEQQTIQETQGKLIEELQKQIESLESKCQNLQDENVSFKTNLESIKEKEHELETIRKDIVSRQIDTQNIQKQIDGLESKCQNLLDENITLKSNLESIKDLELETMKKDIVSLQNSTQEQIKGLESKCQNFADEGDKIRTDLESINKSHMETRDDIVNGKNDIKNQLKEYNEKLKVEWVKINSNLVDGVKPLLDWHEIAKEEIVSIKNTQNNLAAQIDECLQKVAAFKSSPPVFHRPPIKSPSTSSYLNNNCNYNPLTRQRYTPTNSNNFYSNKNAHFTESLDGNDDFMFINEISNQAETLKREVDSLADLHHSFDKSTSIYSDE